MGPSLCAVAPVKSDSTYLVDGPKSDMDSSIIVALVQPIAFEWDGRDQGSKSQNGLELHFAICKVMTDYGEVTMYVKRATGATDGNEWNCFSSWKY